MIRQLLMTSALVFAMGTASAHAACGVVATTGNVQWYGGCSADNQANDGDDLKMFVDRAVQRTQNIEGSLGSNNQAFDNIHSQANADFETDGSGFANFKSVDAGKPTNTLTAYLFSKGVSATLPDGTPFPGFDGELFRGQIDNTGTGANQFNGDLFVRVTFVGGATESHLYTGLSDKNDFGVLGFDEVPGNNELISRVFVSVNSDGASNGAFNEFKQLEFSVPGAVAVIPEPPTWAMGLTGFGLLGLIRRLRMRHARRASILPA